MTARRILLVEDEAAIREMLHMALEREGFEVAEAADGQQAQERLAEKVPDLILLDWMLPGISGVELARRWKKEALTREVPIIMLTARSEEDDRVRGLDVGADDYVTKPFSPRELIARIRAVLRRTSGHGEEEVLEANGLVLDPASHRVTINGCRIDVGPTEYRLLYFFMTHPERVYSRSQLLDHVWGGNVYIEERTIDVHIRRLRKALGGKGHDALVQTVRGSGYRFSTQT
ncbi:phosphate regulon transcriptional regulator PhoB [Thioalkalivibrio thiocyanodenitrificans]|uniref:phosphate regulon transcriptional regulator PhoB n=1 Tax=Thioalkalivibrio thiocyanodenitrificans TaxID=243063 RepID=UPI0003671837|nr:phosphate regulon transcriptional regulator PhoB [Thioalkalivibrio thiocyanodenitrificans]